MDPQNDLVAGVSAANQFKIRELQRRIQALPTSPKDHRRLGLSRELKQELLDCQRQIGIGPRAFCSIIGISCSAFGRWRRKGVERSSSKPCKRKITRQKLKIAKSAFQKVHIKESQQNPITQVHPEQDTIHGLTLETPSGYRIRGLDVEGISRLLRSV